MQGAALCSEHWRQQNPREALLEFDRSRKLMSVACRSGAQRRLFVKGAPEAVVVACSSAIDNSGACCAEHVPHAAFLCVWTDQNSWIAAVRFRGPVVRMRPNSLEQTRRACGGTVS